MIRHIFFWISTVVFLVITLGIIWKVYPPLLGKVNDQRDSLEKVGQNITEEQRYLAVVKSLTDRQQVADQIYDKAVQALPLTLAPDLLLLQLDGLLASLQLGNATVTVPFGQAAVPILAPATPSGETKPGSVGNSSATKPVVSGQSATQTTFTIAGEMDYPKVKALLVALRQFGRWNKVTSIEINKSSDKTTVTVVCQAFAAANTTADFGGSDPNFLNNAGKVFNALKQYTTAPNYQTEGQYGRIDPFATP